MGSKSKSSTKKQEDVVTTPTYDARGQGLINSLVADYNSGGNKQTQESADFFRNAMSTQNPYAQRTVDAMSAAAPREYASNLKQVRTAGFRGGAGADYINQAGLASDFANQLELNKAKLLLDSFNTDRNYGMQAAQSLGDVGTNQASLATSLLGALRGETSQAKSSATTKSSSMDLGAIAKGVGTAVVIAV